MSGMRERGVEVIGKVGILGSEVEVFC